MHVYCLWYNVEYNNKKMGLARKNNRACYDLFLDPGYNICLISVSITNLVRMPSEYSSTTLMKNGDPDKWNNTHGKSLEITFYTDVNSLLFSYRYYVYLVTRSDYTPLSPSFWIVYYEKQSNTGLKLYFHIC